MASFLHQPTWGQIPLKPLTKIKLIRRGLFGAQRSSDFFKILGNSDSTLRFHLNPYNWKNVFLQWYYLHPQHKYNQGKLTPM